jgi:chromate transport protein ChrA
MPGEYDPYLTKSSARGMRILSIAMIAGGIYLLRLSQYAWRTNTKVHLGGGGHSLLWPWEGFATSFLMFLIGVFAWWAASQKAKAWKERERQQRGG